MYFRFFFQCVNGWNFTIWRRIHRIIFCIYCNLAKSILLSVWISFPCILYFGGELWPNFHRYDIFPTMRRGTFFPTILSRYFQIALSSVVVCVCMMGCRINRTSKESASFHLFHTHTKSEAVLSQFKIIICPKTYY